jgi:hypothetical protein
MTNEGSIGRRLESLHTALLADVMDQLGFRDSALGPDIRPMEPGKPWWAGRSRCGANLWRSQLISPAGISCPHTKT